MIITEARLRQIVLEEAQLRLLDMYITEELKRIFEEEGKEVEDKDLKAYKKGVRDQLVSYFKKGLLPGAFVMALLGYMGQETTDYEETKAAENAAAKKLNIEKKSTIENSVKDLGKQAGNFYGWTWQTNATQTLPFPTNPDNKSEAILPPEWSVVAQVAKDKAANTPQYEVDQNYLNAAGSPDALASAYKNIKGSAPTGPATQFFDDFSPDSHPFSDASEMGAHSFRSKNPGVPSAMIDLDNDGAPDNQNLVYIPFGELPDDYVMPNSGMTKEQMYKQYYYGYGMSLEEFKNLKGQLKENRITWKNYKNRKKKLA